MKRGVNPAFIEKRKSHPAKAGWLFFAFAGGECAFAVIGHHRFQCFASRGSSEQRCGDLKKNDRSIRETLCVEPATKSSKNKALH
jgi:hypothetical protein